MKLQPAVKQDTLRIAAGTVCLACVMMLVFLALGHFDLSVLLGALLGCAAAVGNFFLMAMTIQHVVERRQQEAAQHPPAPADADGEAAADEEKPADPLSKADKQFIQMSYTGRMLMIAAVGLAALLADMFHPVATLLPLLFPRIVIFALGILDKSKTKEG